MIKNLISIVLFHVFIYAVAPDVNAQCSGTTTITTTNGSVTDGSGLSNYTDNLDCRWLIQPLGATTITLTFSVFDTEEYCDWVYIYNGATTGAPLLGSYSGTNLPPQIIATAGSLLIQFTSDGSGNAGGWSASWTSTTGATTPVADFNANKTNIAPGEGVVFTDASTNIPSTWNWSFPGGNPSTSTSSNPTVTYNALGSFDVTLIVGNASGSDTMIKKNFIHVEQVIGPCSGTTTLLAQIDTFHDGSGPNDDYAGNANCLWLIQPPNAAQISLSFISFAVDLSDHVYVYDGATITAPLLGSFTGTTLPEEIISTGGSMLVKFVSDVNWTAAGWEAAYTTHLTTDFTVNTQYIIMGQSVTFEDRSTLNPTGWNWVFESGTPANSNVQNPTVTYNSIGDFNVTLTSNNGIDSDTEIKYSYIHVLPPPTCSGTTVLTTSSGSFEDGSAAENYSNNLDCKWLIQPTGATSVTLNFLNFHTEKNADKVRIYDGATTAAPLIGELSGDTLVSAITGTCGSMLVNFISDPSTVTYGWDATYTSSGGSFIPVADFSTDTVNIFTHENVDFTDLSTNNPTSRIWTFSGGNPNTSSLANPTVFYDAPGDYDVKLRVSNSYGSDSITKSTYIHVIDPPGKCGDTTYLTATDGTISDGSGNFDYYDYSDCYWIIQPINALQIFLNFTSFEVDSSDYVNVYDGTSTNSPLLGNYTGFTLPSVLQSSGGVVMIHFVSNSDWVASGWELDYMTITVDYSENEPMLKNVLLFPNPTKGRITLKNIGNSNDFVSLNIYNSLGSEILSYREISALNGMTLDLSGFQNGIYFVKINNSDSSILKKIILLND